MVGIGSPQKYLVKKIHICFSFMYEKVGYTFPMCICLLLKEHCCLALLITSFLKAQFVSLSYFNAYKYLAHNTFSYFKVKWDHYGQEV